MTNRIPHDEDDLEARLRDQFGELLTLEEVAEVMRYPTSDALRKANSRGNAPVKLFKIPNRRGLYARASEVAKSIKAYE